MEKCLNCGQKLEHHQTLLCGDCEGLVITGYDDDGNPVLIERAANYRETVNDWSDELDEDW